MSEANQIEIEFLYVDIESCTRCKGTDANLTTALQMARSLLDAVDARVTVRKTLVDSEQLAVELGLISSPTIRINGREIDVDLRESHCEDCTEICGCGEDIACRVWRYKGEDYEVAPVSVLLNAIMSAVYAPLRADEHTPRPRALSENLRKVFAAKQESTKVCCGPAKAAACCAPEEKASCCGVGSQLQSATCGC
jgi:hypothetical protein